MTRVGLYGGTFDPIHRGHIDPVQAAIGQLGLERVDYLPTAKPPHKRGRRTASAWRRFSMVELALLELEACRVSSFEMGDHEAFTIDTVERYRRVEPGARLFLLIGADSFRQLHTWRRGDELAGALDLAVLTRPGFALDPSQLRPPQRAALEAGRVHYVEHEPVAASSTEIRRLLAKGDTVPAGWLQPRVLEYVKKYGLYRA